MALFIEQFINGLSIGSVYAIVALGFSLVFGVAKVVNFAQGSQVIAGAYIAWAAVTGWGLPLWLAFVLAIIGSIVIAVIVDLVAVEWLGDSAEIAPLLSTLALAFVIDQSIRLIWSPDPAAFPNPLVGSSIRLGAMYIGATDIVILAVTLTFMAGFALLLKYTWMGRAIRAAAQDPVAARQMGVHTSAAKLIVFALSGIIGAIGGILVGMYFQQIDPTMGLPFGLKGFAAAMVGGVVSLPGAVLGGLLIGVAEALADGYIGSAYGDIVAFVLLLLVLVLRPQGLLGSKALEGLGGARGAGAIPTTSTLADSSGFPVTVMGARRISMFWTVLVTVLIGAVAVVAFNSYWSGVFAQGAIFATAALGLTVLTGMTGVVSVGHNLLMGVGAYTCALITTRLGWPFELVLLAVMGVGILSGILFAIPVLRLSGHMVALATLALGQIGYLLMLNAIPVTRGPMGIGGIGDPHLLLLGGKSIDTVAGMTALCFIVLVIALLIVGLLQRGHLALNFRAVREDRLAADAFGVRSMSYMTMAVIVSSIFAGLAGMMFAYQQAYVSPDSFLILFAFLLLTMILAGGIVSPLGAVVGGIVLIVLPELMREYSQYRELIYGVILILIIKFMPSGLTSIRWHKRTPRGARTEDASNSGVTS